MNPNQSVLKCIALMLLIIGGISQSYAQNYSNWGRKQAITIQASQVFGSGSHTDFPILITLNQLNPEIVDGGANAALNGGGDIRFSADANGNIPLAVEVVEFVTNSNVANRKCQIWVKVPNLSTSNNTTIYIWYNKPGESQVSANAPYGSQAIWSNYHFVSHDGRYDSATGQNLTIHGSLGTGQTPYGGKSWLGNGSDAYSSTSASGLNLANNLSVSLWKKNPAPTDGATSPLSVSNSTGWIGLMSMGLYEGTEANTYFASALSGSTDGAKDTSGSGTNWHFVSITETTLAGENELLSVNGILSTDSPTTGNWWSGPTNTGYITIGNEQNGDSYLNGELAEIRISETLIDQDFLKSQYSNMNDPASFAIAGIPEAVSGGGNTSDTTAPTAPTNLQALAVGQTQANLSWSASTDNVGVTAYEVLRNNLVVGTTSDSTSYTDTGLSANTNYSYTVRAKDAAGNTSSSSTTINLTTSSAPDTQSPSVPTNLVASGKTTTGITLSWTASTDNVGVALYEILQGNTVLATVSSNTSYAVTGLTANTTYSFSVRAKDAAGNTSENSTALSVTTLSSGGGGTTTTSLWNQTGDNIHYSDGNVGIGTTSIPNDYKLAVNGKIITEELKVQLQTAWPDYVFQKDYKLPSIEEVAKHIKDKGHLPNIPSAKEVKENGIEVGEMNRLLLEKIEELTLYIMELKKENNDIKKEIGNLKNKSN